MFCHNHKGLGRRLLLLILAAIVGLMVIVITMNIFASKADEATSEQLCRTSIKARVDLVLRSKIFVIPVETKPVVSILCRTGKKELDGKKEEVMRQISELSARCWWMFLEGEYPNLFNEFNFLKENRCFRCYIFTIKEDITIKNYELEKYMRNHYYINFRDKEGNEKKVSYWNYIQSYRGDGKINIGGEEEELEFVGGTGNSYSINLMSPDIPGWSWSKQINSIYIIQLTSKDNDKFKCVFLESI